VSVTEHGASCCECDPAPSRSAGARATAPMARDAAIEACARIAHEADRAFRAARGEPLMPTWVDLSRDARERHVLRAEGWLSLTRPVAGEDRFFVAVLRASAAELGVHAVSARAGSARAVDPLDVRTLEAIAHATAEARGTTVKVLVGNDRTRATTTVRNLAMLIARRDFHFTFEAIGFFFGGRNHATIMSNVECMGNWLRFDEELRAARAQICATLRCTGVTPHDDR
jgi:hypothetical protein